MAGPAAPHLGARELRRWALACCIAGCSVPALGSSWADKLDHGSIRGFPSYNEANKLLDGWLQQYPQVLRKRHIGASFLKRPIYAYILGPGAHRPANCPQVLLTSLTHAREPTSLTVLLYFLGHLLELYDNGGPQATYVLQTREIWFVPFVNPDGYLENEKLRTKIIRKNLRPTCRFKAEGGVDINRNFGFHWKKEFAPCSEEYQGTEPFSEPETQAVKRICEENSFVAAMNFHAFGGMLTHPFNWAQKPQLPADDQRVYSEIGKVFGWKKFGPAIRTVGYTAPGESDDWMYAVRKIISMSPEVGPESGDFWPPRHEIAGINRRNFVRTLYVIKKAGLELQATWAHRPMQAGPSSSNTSQLAGGRPQAVLELVLENTGLSKSTGEVLGVAVSGVAKSAQAPVSGGSWHAMLLRESGDAVEARLADGAASPTLAFQLPPLPRRSTSRVKLLLGRALEPAGERQARLCVAEIVRPSQPGAASAPGPARRAFCHCVGPVRLPAASSNREERTKLLKPEAMVFAAPAAGAAKGDEALCGIAAAGSGAAALKAKVAPRPEPWARTAAGSGAAALKAKVAPRPKPSAGAYTVVLLPTARSPTAGPAAPAAMASKVAIPARIPGMATSAAEEDLGATVAPLVLLSIGGASLTMGLCLLGQVLLNRKQRPHLASSIRRRPQLPPVIDVERVPALPVAGEDDDQSEAVAVCPKV